MKRIISLFFICLLMLNSNILLPQEMNPKKTTANEACVKTLLMGLNSENGGVKNGCAFLFGELCCDRGVIPLLRILHSDPKEEVRIMAALSLYKIGDSRGIFAIKQAIRFDDSRRVSRLCEKFYKAHLLRNSENLQTDVALN